MLSQVLLLWSVGLIKLFWGTNGLFHYRKLSGCRSTFLGRATGARFYPLDMAYRRSHGSYAQPLAVCPALEDLDGSKTWSLPTKWSWPFYGHWEIWVCKSALPLSYHKSFLKKCKLETSWVDWWLGQAGRLTWVVWVIVSAFAIVHD